MKKINTTLFKLNGEKTDFNNYEFLNEGSCAILYKKNDQVLKIYKSSCKYSNYVNKKVFDTLKELNIDNIVKLDNYYYSNDAPKLNKLILPDAYTMKYVTSDNINLLDTSKEYFLDTINSLEKTMNELTKNKIKVFDSHHSNIVFNKEGATIIDIDCYRINNLMTFKKLLLNNKKELLSYIRSKLYYDAHNYKELMIYNYINHILFNINISNNITDEFKKVYIKNNLLKSMINY